MSDKFKISAVAQKFTQLISKLMTNLNQDPTVLKLEISLNDMHEAVFTEWQSKFNVTIALQTGFISIEFLSPIKDERATWLIIQRFSTNQYLLEWQHSSSYQNLLYELQEKLHLDKKNIHISQTTFSPFEKGIIEIFISEIKPGKEKEFRAWIAKIHGIEAKFPGFCGTYLQSPVESGGKYWITLLQFSTLPLLENWLQSEDRFKLLQEGSSLVISLENHRMVSPYAGWFSSISNPASPSPVWKQTMLVLLVLFPIVVLEMKYLSPLLTHFNSSLATFIGNAISVTLIAWPFMPLALNFLKWWLVSPISKQKNIQGLILVLTLYLCEILLFLHFL